MTEELEVTLCDGPFSGRGFDLSPDAAGAVAVVLEIGGERATYVRREMGFWSHVPGGLEALRLRPGLTIVRLSYPHELTRSLGATDAAIDAVWRESERLVRRDLQEERQQNRRAAGGLYPMAELAQVFRSANDEVFARAKERRRAMLARGASLQEMLKEIAQLQAELKMVNLQSVLENHYERERKKIEYARPLV